MEKFDFTPKTVQQVLRATFLNEEDASEVAHRLLGDDRKQIEELEAFKPVVEKYLQDHNLDNLISEFKAKCPKNMELNGDGWLYFFKDFAPYKDSRPIAIYTFVSSIYDYDWLHNIYDDYLYD